MLWQHGIHPPAQTPARAHTNEFLVLQMQRLVLQGSTAQSVGPGCSVRCNAHNQSLKLYPHAHERHRAMRDHERRHKRHHVIRGLSP